MGSPCSDVLVSGCASIQLCPRLSPVSPTPQMCPPPHSEPLSYTGAFIARPWRPSAMGLGEKAAGRMRQEQEEDAGGGGLGVGDAPTSSPNLGSCKVRADRGMEELILSRIQSKGCHRPG